jgi:hypothetical protein
VALMLGLAVSAMASMAMEQVHQRASQDEQIWQNAENMCPMFGDQEESANSQEADQDEPRCGPPPWHLRRVLVSIHLNLPCDVSRYG